eukprot:165577-Prorocentrum_lima.AAC.1
MAASSNVGVLSWGWCQVVWRCENVCVCASRWWLVCCDGRCQGVHSCVCYAAVASTLYACVRACGAH